MFLIKLVFSPVRIVLFLARMVGYSRFGLFVVGLAIGLLFAPTTGRELRQDLADRIEALTGGTPAPA